MPHVTDHAYVRGKQRTGLKKASLERLLERVLEEGIQHSDTTGKLRKYMDWLYLSHEKGTSTRIYGGHVYILRGDVLITVISLPNQYRGSVAKIAAKKNKNKRVV
jgi:hypothetical protein